MAKQLGTTVHVHGHGIFGPGDKLPAEVRKILADNPRVWSDEDDGEAEEAHPGPSETAAAGAAVEAALKARIAELEAQAAANAGSSENPAGNSGTAEAAPPPKAGPGSAAERWREYAARKDVEVAENATRDEVIAELQKAGVATEREQ